MKEVEKMKIIYTVFLIILGIIAYVDTDNRTLWIAVTAVALLWFILGELIRIREKL